MHGEIVVPVFECLKGIKHNKKKAYASFEDKFTKPSNAKGKNKEKIFPFRKINKCLKLT